jgi:allophanate hydrolase subunit 1
MENLVRQVLKSVRVSTSTFDADNIETENSLNALLERPEVAEIFGPDVVFELRALYCEQVGPNLRNQVAHGLLDDDESVSLHSVYAWWQALRLIYMPYWNQYQVEAEPAQGSDQ